MAIATVCVTATSTIASATREPITTYALADLTDIDALSVSPNGQWIVLLSRTPQIKSNTYRQVWLLVPTSQGRARELADAGEPILLSLLGVRFGPLVSPKLAWSPDSRRVAFVRQDGGRRQLWLADIRSRHAQRITNGAADVTEVTFSADGSRILYRTEPSAKQMAEALLAEGRSGILYGTRFAPPLSYLPVLPGDASYVGGDGVRREWTTGEQRARQQTRTYTIASRADRAATQRELVEFQEATQAAPLTKSTRLGPVRSRGRSVAWAEAQDPTRQGFAAPLTVVARFAGSNLTITCEASICTGSVAAMWWRNDKDLLFLAQDGLAAQDFALYSWSGGTSEPRLVTRFPNPVGEYATLPCVVVLDRLLCLFEEASYPTRLVAIDLNTGARQVLFDPNPSFAKFELGAAPRRIAISARGAPDTYGYLVLPPNTTGNQKLPLVVVTYRCGGFLRGGVGNEYPIFAFAQQGFAVLCYNVADNPPEMQTLTTLDSVNAWSRGPGDREKRAVQASLSAVINRLEQEGVIDGSRVGLTGLSFGGETVMYALFNMKNLTAAVASGTEFGPLNSIVAGPTTEELMRQWGLDDWLSDRWKVLSVTRNTDKVWAPLLLNVSDHELLLALHQHYALKRSGRAVEMFVFPQEYHVKWQPAHRLAIYNRNIDWMNFWLRGVESGLVGAPDQYARWRTMRDNQCRLFGINGTERGVAESLPWYCEPGAIKSDAVVPK